MAEKQTLKFYFSTEGETEKWYLEHLQTLINNCTEAEYKVSFIIKVCRPKTFIKRVVNISRTTIYHFFDVESVESEYIARFNGVFDEMLNAEKMGKEIKYENGYSNLTFELWILLHKVDCNGSIYERKNYLEKINKTFNTRFQGIKEYKEENHFKNILKTITLDDVRKAITRAKSIDKNNQQNGYTKVNYEKYSWYKENPSTAVGNIIGEIINKCEIK